MCSAPTLETHWCCLCDYFVILSCANSVVLVKAPEALEAGSLVVVALAHAALEASVVRVGLDAKYGRIW